MALFKKPKRNIRIRNIDEDDEVAVDDLSEPMEVDTVMVGNGVKKSKEKKIKDVETSSKAATLLSFADDEEDHGEVFQVKKSSYSKKLEKKLEKERRRKKEQMEVDPAPVQKKVEEAARPEDDLVVIVKRDEEQQARKKRNDIIVNGRAALMVGKNDVSSSDEDEGSTRFKFSQSARSEITIESGKIPDAATIHAARKRRERARQLGSHDFIPVENHQPKPKKSHTNTEAVFLQMASSMNPISAKDGKGTSRLVREEEDDGSDEERINMGLGLEANDMQARRVNYYEHIDQPGELETVEPVAMTTSWPIAQPMSAFLPPPPPPPTATATKELVPASVVLQRLRDRLSELREAYDSHFRDVTRVATELSEHTSETAQLESEAPSLAAKFRFYQDMRGYVTDLVECLDEKVPGLLKLEASALKLWSDRAANFSARRRLDVRDQADEWAQSTKNTSGPRWSREEEEARSRRAAEREGRRARRRRARESRSLGISHIDGMSSDDEETELEASTFFKKIDELRELGSDLLEDVESEFGTVEGVTQRLQRWREFDMTAYREAYVSMCLPKVLGPLVRLHLLVWNPLQADAAELDSSTWWGRLLLYGLERGETPDSLAADPDVCLAPTLLEKAVVPKVADIVSSSWDPLSCSQTIRLVNFLNRYVVEMPMGGMSSNSPQVTRLLEAVLKRLRHAVDNDVFIPINFTGGEPKGSSSPFFQRQFASAVRLLRNMLSLQGLIDVNQLYEIALDGLLNRYLLAALRTCTPVDAISKANMVMSTFPRWWFQTETKIPKLEMLGRHLKQLSTQVVPFETTEKDSCELVQSLLRTIQLSCPTNL